MVDLDTASTRLSKDSTRFTNAATWRVQFGVRDGAVDPPVALGKIGVEVICTEHDFQSPCAPHQQGQALQRTPTRYQPGADLRLPEDGVLAACEADVASHREFAAATSHSGP